MIAHTKTKLSIAMLASVLCLGFAGAVQAMDMDKETRFLLDEKRTIERFLDSGKAILENPQEIVGKDMLTVLPFRAMEEKEKLKIEEAFLNARNKLKVVKCDWSLFDIVMHTTITPMKDHRGVVTFLVKITKELPHDFLSLCGGAPEDISLK